MDLFDVEVSERVEGELDRLIEKRAEQARIEELWAQSARRDRERRREENRRAWRSYHLLLAGNHAALCDEHRAKAARLDGEGDPVPRAG